VPDVFDESDQLADELLCQIDLPLLNDSERVRTSDVACSLSIEHWYSTRALLRAGVLSSALVVHRAQFEALVRSLWLAYAASDEQVAKLARELTVDNDQAAKGVPLVKDMMTALEKTAPSQAYEALARFKAQSWAAMNSYAHAGLHPLRRHAEGYPSTLIEDVLRNANGLAVMSCMQAVVLSGQQPRQRDLIAQAAKHPRCMPPLL
jgi:hypothetical protein